MKPNKLDLFNGLIECHFHTTAHKKMTCLTAGHFLHPVEMAGIEPASERFDHRISTSVVSFWFSLKSGATNKPEVNQPLGP